MKTTTDYRALRAWLLQDLLFNSYVVDVGEWHAQDVSGKPELVSQELAFVNFMFWLPEDLEVLQTVIEPNLPWAEDHFQERVGGEPLNPSPSEAWWPYAVADNAQHKEGEVFSHTYPERMWPKRAGAQYHNKSWPGQYGVRYFLGDLDDVVELLARSPLSRQAYLPIWFPEDTGATEGQRVPCSLGYHFMMRQGKLHCQYTMRSCDFVRHFADDMYMASRLLQFVVGKLRERGQTVWMGMMHVNISSLHFFEGDRAKMRSLLDEWRVEDYD